MTNLDEKKLDDLASMYEPDEASPFEDRYQCFVDGYRQAFADQQKKIEKLEKAVELMQNALSYFMEPYDCEIEILPDFHYRKAETTLAEVDSILEGEE